MVQVRQKDKATLVKNNTNERILLAHGGGGRLTEELINSIFLPAFSNEKLDQLGDSAMIELGQQNICFTTDSYVVKPLFFNGGNIGKLAVCGTVNDLAVAGAKPLALSIGLIIEEGFEIKKLKEIIASAADTARSAGVKIVTGDTKVVEKGSADGIFINTAGIGAKIPNANIDTKNIQTGDQVIVSGTLGDHGMTIMAMRKEINFDTPLQSDCAPLNSLTASLIEAAPDDIKFMRDPTRGGLAATVNEIASAAGKNIEIVKSKVPVSLTVQAACEILGFDPIEIANEGKLVIVAKASAARKILDTCKNHPLGKDAAIIGSIAKPDTEPIVEMLTEVGGRTIVQMPYGRELPRIC
jgi:hydrogenase expression/formation protein HypE